MTSIDREGQCYAPAHPNDDAEDARQPSELALPEAMSTTATIPVFGTDSILDGSPRVGMPEDFMAYLFNTQQGEGISMAGMAMPTYKSVPILPKTPSSLLTAGSYGEVSHNSYNKPSGGEGDYRPQPTVVSVLSLLDQNPHEAIVSDEKSLEIFDFIKERFHDNGRAPVERLRDAILNGDRSQDTHMLSRTMMQAYIISYWVKFSDQVPIQHKPTFCPAKTERLLLIAMMTIGAACLDKAHGKQVTKAGAQLSNFLAWNLRLEIFKDPAFRPPAKLWVFQALLLLELYEKMYSTRDHHEYAHLFHATTITLMRRGRALIGKSPPDSPPRPDKGRSRHSSDEWWNDWITNEATRRVAFTAFIIDSIHGTMFGHSAMMAAHEMRLPLPCDDKLWKATSSAEVGRFEANAMSGSSRPISFLEGIKQTLGGTPVVTNSFGRTVLMAGLLSVGWHMNQRDLQINSLGNGISEALGGRDRWRSIMIRAFDTWKNDFDDSLLQRESQTYPRHSAERGEANHVFESCMVLHHLAHMAMHVDIVDCQIFARAKRLLGRAIGPQDLASVQRRMKDWAPTAKARDAAFYALKFLASVLLHPAKTRNNSFGGGFGGGFDGGFDGGEVYSARDDVLLNRAWVLYFAALVVWCYGFALEGPDADARAAKSPRDNLVAMREYLSQYSAINTPDVLRQMKGVNRNTPVLLVLQGSFEESRWELLNEGAILLRNCLSLNRGDHL